MKREDDIIITWTDLCRWFLLSTAAGLLAGGTIGWLGCSPAGERGGPGEACVRPPFLTPFMPLRAGLRPRADGFMPKIGGNP